MKTLSKYAAFLLLALISISCEKEKSGVIDPSVITPLLVSASVSTMSINLDSLTQIDGVSGSIYRLHVVLNGTAAATGGPAIQKITYRLFAPGSTTSMQTGSLALQNAGDTVGFSGAVSFSVLRTDIGIYSAAIYATNSAGLSSGSALLTFTVTRNDSRPTLSGLAAPDTIVRPQHGRSVIVFSVAVADSDGYLDITNVKVRLIWPSISTDVPMYDNGDVPNFGDQRAADGIFSCKVQIDSSNSLGDKLFYFFAKDKAGAVSDSLIHRITIVQ